MNLKMLLLALPASLLGCYANADGHADHQKQQLISSDKSCAARDINCAKTVTSGFAPDGKLWRLWSGQDQLFYSISPDKGVHFGQPQRVDIDPEPISAKGENRPKLGFDQQGRVYLSWAKPLSQRFTSDVRLSYSIDGGHHFSTPITVNNDGLAIGHSFNEMLVAADGQVTLTWLDSRERQRDPNYIGSALYAATGQLTSAGFNFNNVKLADQTCVCCRIAMTSTADNKIAALWRHIYDDNIRDHAILTFDLAAVKSGKVDLSSRTTFDQWQINGCPHQGPGLSVDGNNRYHMVWFNNGTQGKGLFYAYSDHQGQQPTKPLSFGTFTAQAAYANVISVQERVDLVWTEFDGKNYRLYHQRSTDRGEHFGQPQVLSDSSADPDRPFLLQYQGQTFVSWHRAALGHQVIAL